VPPPVAATAAVAAAVTANTRLALLHHTLTAQMQLTLALAGGTEAVMPDTPADRPFLCCSSCCSRCYAPSGANTEQRKFHHTCQCDC
jgi:hypothetical protein